MQSQIEMIFAVSLVFIFSRVIISHYSLLSVSGLFQTGSLALYLCLKYFQEKDDFLPLIVISVSAATIILINGIKLYVHEVKK